MRVTPFVNIFPLVLRWNPAWCLLDKGLTTELLQPKILVFIILRFSVLNVIRWHLKHCPRDSQEASGQTERHP